MARSHHSLVLGLKAKPLLSYLAVPCISPYIILPFLEPMDTNSCLCPVPAMVGSGQFRKHDCVKILGGGLAS